MDLMTALGTFAGLAAFLAVSAILGVLDDRREARKRRAVAK